MDLTPKKNHLSLM